MREIQIRKDIRTSPEHFSVIKTHLDKAKTWQYIHPTHKLPNNESMVAIARDNKSQVLFDGSPGPEEHQKLSPKQLKRIEDQKEREEKKIARRKAKAMQKERRAAEREYKEAKREERIKEERKENSGLSAKEMQEKERLEEEKILFAKEFLQEETVLPANHVKKSTLESNRLGGKHMC